jgi:hypothetical protein
LTAIKLRKFIDISKSKDEKLEAELKKLQMNKSILIIAKNPPLCTSFATASAPPSTAYKPSKYRRESDALYDRIYKNGTR